jgi:AcrR family transcriptional regulator
MPGKDRRARERQMLRQEILDAARALFIREGYDHVSMRKIAEKIDYSPTTIYLYFKNKEELMFAVCEETFAGLVRELTAVEKKAKDPVEGLKKGLRAYVDFGLRHPQHYLLSFVLPHEHGHDSARYVSPEAMGMKAFAFLRRAIQECIRQKKFRAMDVEAASQALWAAMHGVTSLLIVHKDFPWVRRDLLVETVMDSALRHLKGEAR